MKTRLMEASSDFETKPYLLLRSRSRGGRSSQIVSDFAGEGLFDLPMASEACWVPASGPWSTPFCSRLVGWSTPEKPKVRQPSRGFLRELQPCWTYGVVPDVNDPFDHTSCIGVKQVLDDEEPFLGNLR